MGRPPSNGGPSFRFNPVEIAEMEAILQAHRIAMPAREVLVALAEKFSNSEERKGKIEVQMKQVWNWFQNRRYAIRAKAGKSPGKLNVPQMTRDDPTIVKGVPQATQPHAASSATVRSLPQVPQHPTVPSAAVRTFPQAPQNTMSFSVQSAGRVADNSQMEYEAKSARDGAWYDVSTFLSHRSLETGDPEVMVRFAGFGAEEDEWVNVRKNVRQRSLPCEASECVAVLPADLILCFQEGKEQALYFDAHVLDAQRRRHDVRGCRCRFLVRYDHDQSEEIVALRKICRRPETDYRLQQLHAVNESLSANQNKNGTNNIHTVSTLRVYPPAEVQPKQLKAEPTVVVPPPSLAETPSKRQKVETAVPTSPLETTTVLAAQPVDVPQDQQKVQAAPSPVVELAAQPVDVPQDHQKVQAASTPVVEPVLPSPVPSVEPSVEPQKVEPVVPVASAQDSMEVEKAGSIAPTGSDEVALELHKVQPVMPDPSGEVSREPEAMGAVVPPSTATETPVEPPHEGELEVAQPQEELMVHSSSAEVQTKLPELQPASAVEAVETKAEVPVELPEAQPATALEAVETKADVQAEMPEIQPISALEAGETKDEVSVEMSEVQPASAVEAIETKHEVQVELPKSAGETKDEVQVELPEVQTASALETGEAKHEVPVELPEEQPASALEAIRTKDEVQVELPEVQPASAPEAGETKDEVPAELSEAQPANPLEEMETKAEVPEVLPEVQPASALEAAETKAEVPEELHEVQPASALEAVETKVEVAEESPEVQPATVCESIETKVNIPAALPEVQPASEVEAIETKAEVSEELSEGQPSNVNEAKAEEPMVPVSTDDSNMVEEAVGMDVEEPVGPDNTNDSNVVEAEVEQPKDSETMDIDDRNVKEDEHANDDKVGNSDLQPGTIKDDMEEV